VFPLSEDGQSIHPDSAFGFAAKYGDTVTTLGHPVPGRESEYLDAVVDSITGPTIILGLSTGGQIAERIFQSAVAAGKLRHLYLVLAARPTRFTPFGRASSGSSGTC
jgi:hypothetical protein